MQLDKCLIVIASATFTLSIEAAAGHVFVGLDGIIPPTIIDSRDVVLYKEKIKSEFALHTLQFNGMYSFKAEERNKNFRVEGSKY
jgi:hypothetical protein